MSGVRYEDMSDRAFVELLLKLSPIVEDMAEVIRQEIYSEISRMDGPSGPGEAPAVDTDAYRRSWSITSAKRLGDAIVASAFNKQWRDPGGYIAHMLEYGTKHMEPRPHILPALERAKKRIDRMTREASRA